MNIIFNPSLGKHEADVSLLHAAQGGDKIAVNKLIKLLAPNAHALAWSMLNSSADAEDIVQDALVKLLQSTQYEGRASLSTFFYSIVSNGCLDFLRKRTHDPWDEENEELHLSSNDEEPEEALNGKQQSSHIQALLQKLSPRQRLAISLWAYNDASILDIASALHIEVNAANQLLHRAKVNLKHFIQKEKNHALRR